MKITIDENIVFAREAFSVFGEVELVNGRTITRDKIKDTDILIIRSVTEVNPELLKNTAVRFVGTTTIGTDHIDLNYLSKNGIAFASAPGSNANSVAEYVFAAILSLAEKFRFAPQEKSLGIIGVGNIGKIVAKYAKALGMKIALNDPPRADAGEQGFVSLDETLRCDIITLHTPLNLSGKYKSYHLINGENLRKISDGTILINAARGSVIDNSALTEVLSKGKITAVMDVWENEPEPKQNLIKFTEIATPHIAGYSYDGKLNGAEMIFEALNKFLNTNYKWEFAAASEPLTIDCSDEKNTLTVLRKIFKTAYDIEKESENFKRKIIGAENPGKVFDEFRKNYPKRLELKNYKAIVEPEIDSELLKKFGIKIEIKRQN